MKTNKLDIGQALFKDKVINKLAIVDYVKAIEKENQELKDNNEALAVEFNRLNEVLDKERQDQFLKVVESVFEEHFEYDNYFNIKCNCGYTIDNDFEEHLLQEIKSAMEKGKE